MNNAQAAAWFGPTELLTSTGTYQRGFSRRHLEAEIRNF